MLYSRMIFVILLGSSMLYSSQIEENLKTIEYSLSFQNVDISKTDVNRIICNNGEIGKIIYSKDKEISIQKDGENAFVKLSPVTTRSNGVVISTIVNEFVRDVYFECNNEIFSLNLIPKDISAQTVLLTNTSGKKNNTEAQKFEKANSFEKTVLNIIKYIYKDKIPDGYTVKKLNPKNTNFSELVLTPIKIYEGNEYYVYEYKIKALKDIELDEKMFVNYIAKNPLAISLVDLNLKKYKETRLIVISNATADPLTYDKKVEFKSTIKSNNQRNKILKNNEIQINLDEEVQK